MMIIFVNNINIIPFSLDFRFLSELLRREKEVRTDESTILKLEAKEGVERFSVATSTDVEFVTVFRLKNTLRKVVKCHSSFCQHKQGKTRSISSLNSSSNLCEHLMLFKTWFQASEGTSTHDELSYGFEDMDLAGNELLGELEDDVEAENSIDRLLPKAVVSIINVFMCFARYLSLSATKKLSLHHSINVIYM